MQYTTHDLLESIKQILTPILCGTILKTTRANGKKVSKAHGRRHVNMIERCMLLTVTIASFSTQFEIIIKDKARSTWKDNQIEAKIGAT